jgi:signal transduction histidine kinase
MRTISHETLTPLAVMMGYAQITAKDARKSGIDGEFVENLDTIAAEAKRIAAMMEEMRQLALVREYTKDRRAVDIGKIIEQVAGLYRAVLDRKDTGLVLNIADSLPPIFGNDSEVIQIIFNLLRNADNHTENGTVTIRAEYTGTLIKVTVSDTGTGISPELMPRVFERGVHGDNKGSGYGLAICRDIITAYGGEIWIESRTGRSGDGENGTDAIFTLPPYSEERSGANE